ncbi:XRE family transcriptional regulator [Roseburia sp. AF22-2LB]|uniref:helix-turn-helix domain-containing protein n=1 Tax=unclassified Roseburia TaxID=2637578 RepID=UPI000E535EA2|nr:MULTISPECIES: helix-turn-helix transcriptional regulator [unclassified Roseburia]RGG38243.1 XRE family transcriptional regulator [Roseburia sp. AF22-8AC]RGG42470.1 XRE family transcriptional regulator [Roseburia sp. AF22-2LB]
MKCEGYKIGPVIRDIRKDKGLLIEEVASKTGISVSTLGQVEQGGRNLSMKNLYKLMDLYETDANTLLAIETTPDSLESKLNRLPVDKQKYLKDTFNYMIEQALKSA